MIFSSGKYLCWRNPLCFEASSLALRMSPAWFVGARRVHLDERMLGKTRIAKYLSWLDLVVTCQSQGIHALKRALFYCLFDLHNQAAFCNQCSFKPLPNKLRPLLMHSMVEAEGHICCIGPVINAISIFKAPSPTVVCAKTMCWHRARKGPGQCPDHKARDNEQSLRFHVINRHGV